MNEAVRYVTVESNNLTHAVLTVDLDRGLTVCGLPSGDVWSTAPTTDHR
ncbi:hypothetical protein GCM10023321_43620 [Pseudonocardia eucalypti]|uniref:Uncharacterized protein n=1 Tax=Pseudonocardia eucalypti TaxID=648755 RepID=A0ABP9QEK7_9PSEU|nr:hypothetical protein [Pseudonocardia eucalypti]